MISRIALPLCCLVACCDSESPVDRSYGPSSIVQQVGPEGGTLRGPGGSALQGFSLQIPPGALDRLVEITVQSGADVPLPQSVAVSGSYSIRVDPDPGVLLRPALLVVGSNLSRPIRESDLFVAVRRPVDRPSVLPAGSDRLGVAADYGEYDEASMVFVASIQILGELQVRRATGDRLPEDALRLVQLGYERLADLTDASLGEADELFEQAQRADPFAGAANLFRALARLLIVVNDRTDDSPGIDSLGEALQRSGLDVNARSLVERLRTGSWPRRVVVPPDAPAVSELATVLRTELRPAVEAALIDLDRVPATIQLIFALPPAIPFVLGDREVDAGDVLAFRTLLSATAFLVDHLADYDLDVDTAWWTAPSVGPPPTLRDLLDRHPAFGSLLTAPTAATDEAARATIRLLRETLETIDAETDEQSDDLVVFRSSLSGARRDLWLDNLGAIEAALLDGVEQRVAFEDGSGSLMVRIGEPWRNAAISPRAFVPDLFQTVPLAGTLPDPTAGGVFPRMTQDRASDLLGFASVHTAPRLQILADGSFGDWSAAAEALTPADPIEDVGDTRLADLDLWRVYFAENDDELAFRIGLASGSIGFRLDQATVYGFVVRDVGASGLGDPLEIEVHVTNSGPDVRVRRNGVPRQVRAAAAWRGTDLELTVDRFQLYDPDEPVRDRAIHAFSQGLSLQTSEAAGDRSRPFLVRF